MTTIEITSANTALIPDWAMTSDDTFDLFMESRLIQANVKRLERLPYVVTETPDECQEPSYMDDSWGDYDNERDLV